MSSATPGPHSLLLAIDRSDLTTLLPLPPCGPAPEPDSGQAVLRIDRFALTANNVTYAAFGEALRYWSFFPHASGAGVLPVWGFADVAKSGVDELEPGERIYGYLPPARWLVVEPGRIDPGGFVDQATHRAPLPAIYNAYRRVAGDAGFSDETELADMVLRPLFMTSFLIDDYLADNDDFGAAQVIVSSASSKTALGVAFQLANRSESRPTLIGLTSPGNVEFVEQLGLYDRVVAYPDIAGKLDDVDSVFVDIAGSAEIRAAVHGLLDKKLALSLAVGASHWHELRPAAGLPGPSPKQFFAPTRYQERIGELGTAEFMQRFAESWQAFVAFAAGWMREKPIRGADALAACYRELVKGTVDPTAANIYESGS